MNTPLLFKDEMVRAILSGRKTQTRRIVKPQPNDRDQEIKFDGRWLMYRRAGVGWCNDQMCPYGVPGDVLWVREAWRVFGGREYEYQKQREAVQYRADALSSHSGKWRPSIFMPRWASRLQLLITDIECARLQDISDQDCFREGIHPIGNEHHPSIPRREFRELWDSINAEPRPQKGEDGSIVSYISFPWESQRTLDMHRGKPWHIVPNPWVWVISFKRIEGGN